VTAGARRSKFSFPTLTKLSRNREKSGVVVFCSVTVELSSYLGSYVPSSDRGGRSLCYRHVHHFNLLLDSLITLNLTKTRYAYTYVNFEL
jgi:hypothetical protein